LGGKTSFIVLLVIVAVLTLVLAIMAGYLLLVAGSPQPVADASNNSAAQAQIVPDANEISRRILFEEKKFFNLKSDEGENSVIQIGAELVYFKKVKGIKNVEQKITDYESQIKEVMGTYFQQLTLEEVKEPGSKKKAKEDLKKQINSLLCSNEKSKYDIVYDIVFEEWFYQ
jgi:flagellar basal body-associated protein FliL